MVNLPEPTHRLLEHVAVMRGQTLTATVYELAQEELARQGEAKSWTPIPSPFAISQNYFESGGLVVLWTPFHKHPAVLTAPESAALANGLTAFADGLPGTTDLTTAFRGQHVALKRCGTRATRILIDGDGYAITRQVAREVAQALDDAAVGALRHVEPEVVRLAA